MTNPATPVLRAAFTRNGELNANAVEKSILGAQCVLADLNPYDSDKSIERWFAQITGSSYDATRIMAALEELCQEVGV